MGYSLVLRTHLTVHQHPNGLTSHWEMVEVVKNRWFEIEGETVEHEDEHGQPHTDWQPRLYDLMPIKGPP